MAYPEPGVFASGPVPATIKRFTDFYMLDVIWQRQLQGAASLLYLANEDFPF